MVKKRDLLVVRALQLACEAPRSGQIWPPACAKVQFSPNQPESRQRLFALASAIASSFVHQKRLCFREMRHGEVLFREGVVRISRPKLGEGSKLNAASGRDGASHWPESTWLGSEARIDASVVHSNALSRCNGSEVVLEATMEGRYSTSGNGVRSCGNELEMGEGARERALTR